MQFLFALLHGSNAQTPQYVHELFKVPVLLPEEDNTKATMVSRSAFTLSYSASTTCFAHSEPRGHQFRRRCAPVLRREGWSRRRGRHPQGSGSTRAYLACRPRNDARVHHPG